MLGQFRRIVTRHLCRHKDVDRLLNSIEIFHSVTSFTRGFATRKIAPEPESNIHKKFYKHLHDRTVDGRLLHTYFNKANYIRELSLFDLENLATKFEQVGVPFRRPKATSSESAREEYINELEAIQVLAR
jgi:hypothetical protein